MKTWNVLFFPFLRALSVLVFSEELVFPKMLGLMFLILLQSFVRVIETWKEKMKSSFNFYSATVKWNECLNLCSWRWFRLSRSLVSSFNPIGLWQPKILSAVGLMNLRIFDLKMLSVSELLMFESNLFHSIMVAFNYGWWKIFKKLVLHIDMGDILCVSSSILTIWLWDYIRKVFRALVFIYVKKET